MKTHSCGAILYMIHEGQVCIVLGMEKGDWFPFKGTRERGETNIQTAIREINEETCGVVNVKYIELNCNFTTKRKHYHIGLIKITSEEFDAFYTNKDIMLKKINTQDYNFTYMEKTDIKKFPINDISNIKFHEISTIPIKFYYKYLIKLQYAIDKCSSKLPEYQNEKYEKNITYKPFNNFKPFNSVKSFNSVNFNSVKHLKPFIQNDTENLEEINNFNKMCITYTHCNFKNIMSPEYVNSIKT